MKGFIEFIRQQGVVGLAVGFILGAAVSSLVNSLVTNLINPLIGVALGRVNLTDKAWHLSNGKDLIANNADDLVVRYGAVISTFIDLIIIAAVVYFSVKMLKLDQLDKQKD